MLKRRRAVLVVVQCYCYNFAFYHDMLGISCSHFSSPLAHHIVNVLSRKWECLLTSFPFKNRVRSDISGCNIYAISRTIVRTTSNTLSRFLSGQLCSCTLLPLIPAHRRWTGGRCRSLGSWQSWYIPLRYPAFWYAYDCNSTVQLHSWIFISNIR